MAEYFKDSRNVKKLKDPSKCVIGAKQSGRREWGGQNCRVWEWMAIPTLPSPSSPALRFRLLKHTRLNVVAFLNELPKTQHDVNSFVVDISAQTVSAVFVLAEAWHWEVDGTCIGETAYIISDTAFVSFRAHYCVFLSMGFSKKVRIFES